jgi:hypothetical protein
MVIDNEPAVKEIFSKPGVSGESLWRGKTPLEILDDCARAAEYLHGVRGCTPPYRIFVNEDRQHVLGSILCINGFPKIGEWILEKLNYQIEFIMTWGDY